MLEMNLQFFGGRGSGGGKNKGGGGGGGSTTSTASTASVGSKPSTTESVRSAREDWHNSGNFLTLRGSDFKKDMSLAENSVIGATVKVKYYDGGEQFLRKTGDNTWVSDTGRKWTNNDLASSVYDAKSVVINNMDKRKRRR